MKQCSIVGHEQEQLTVNMDKKLYHIPRKYWVEAFNHAPFVIFWMSEKLKHPDTSKQS